MNKQTVHHGSYGTFTATCTGKQVKNPVTRVRENVTCVKCRKVLAECDADALSESQAYESALHVWESRND